MQDLAGQAVERMLGLLGAVVLSKAGGQTPLHVHPASGCRRAVAVRCPEQCLLQLQGTVPKTPRYATDVLMGVQAAQLSPQRSHHRPTAHSTDPLVSAAAFQTGLMYVATGECRMMQFAQPLCLTCV